MSYLSIISFYDYNKNTVYFYLVTTHLYIKKLCMLTIKTLIKVFNKIFATFLRVYTKIIVRRREEQY